MSQESIKTLLDKINLLFNVFMKDGLEKVSSLEKELLKEQIQKLLEELNQLDSVKTVIETAPIVQEIKVEINPPTPVEVTFAFEEEQQQEIVDLEQLPLEELIPETIIKNEVKEDKVIEPITLDSVEEVKNTETRAFNENKPTRSLKEIIDLNKSFILKAELFENNHEAYTQFITSLNGIQTEEESINLVASKAKELTWDVEGKAYELLLRAVEKRFLPLLQQ